ncbi:A/G-specific adenine glycosylase [Anaeromyxobacter sp. Fw109-5]|uniref:A/G-specific adenine glycosylase n=1 Tax=Anaeromyxobacter sp. (strain Fw109-5) TaxID=404589 RepID=UPI000158A440|nr:A/G-specific adenine glycosylase [Anaeromyxobacter sp. Fw109-5]ABS26109.1 A/G-specific adenine glycosylase [Anaeromyxobacter sp. Fw109-5]
MIVPSGRRAALRRRLLAWYDAERRALPWRFAQRGADPYRVWISEVMLQQTQVATVVPYFERFVARFPTLEALAAAPEDEVLARWRGLGYYARARNLHAAARAALARHGALPSAVDALRALPGFGPYTAGAVASIAFARPAPAVDGNVARVLARLFCVEGSLAAPATQRRLWDLAGELVPPDRPGDFNQALMELGAMVCRKAAPGCARCPLRTSCAARRLGRAEQVPPARRRGARRAVTMACAVAEVGGALVLVRRAPGGLLGGLWDLPAVDSTGATEAHAAAALLRELRGRFGARVAVGAPRGEVTRTLTHRTLTLRAHACVVPARRAHGEGVRLVPPEALAEVGMSAATRALLAAAGWPGRSSRR